jgi:hypothetical protein
MPYTKVPRPIFPLDRPARTTITNGLSGTLKYGIECIAAASQA